MAGRAQTRTRPRGRAAKAPRRERATAEREVGEAGERRCGRGRRREAPQHGLANAGRVPSRAREHGRARREAVDARTPIAYAQRATSSESARFVGGRAARCRAPHNARATPGTHATLDARHVHRRGGPLPRNGGASVHACQVPRLGRNAKASAIRRHDPKVRRLARRTAGSTGPPLGGGATWPPGRAQKLCAMTRPEIPGFRAVNAASTRGAGARTNPTDHPADSAPRGNWEVSHTVFSLLRAGFWLIRRSRIPLRNRRSRAFRPNRRPNRPLRRLAIRLAQLRAGPAHELVELGAVVALRALLQLRIDVHRHLRVGVADLVHHPLDVEVVRQQRDRDVRAPQRVRCRMRQRR